jgi:hypothetical protein
MAAAPETTRRAFLRFLAASPLLPYLHLPRDWMTALAREPDLIKAAKDALDEFDFEAVARRNLSPAHFGYLERARSSRGCAGSRSRRYSACPPSRGGRSPTSRTAGRRTRWC